MGNLLGYTFVIIVYAAIVHSLHWFMPFKEANEWTARILWSLLTFLAMIKLYLWWRYHAIRDERIGIQLFPETKTTRSVWWRADRYGLYLMFFNGDRLRAGVAVQYPVVISGNRNFKPGFGLWSWGEDQPYDCDDGQ